MPGALAVHDAILQRAVAAQGGRIFKTIGDAVCAVFAEPLDGVRAAIAAQRELFATDWQALGLAQPLTVRMALQAGEAVERDGDFSGLVLNRISRLLRAGHGGQVLLTRSVAGELERTAIAGVGLRDLGERRLRDVPGANRIYQLEIIGLPATFPPLETLDTIAHNLPVALNTCLDREAELAEIRRLLLDSPARLVTLLGPGGIGKTRLALHAATQLIDAFPGGIWFVDLSGIRDAALMPTAVASVLGMRIEAGSDTQRALTEAIGDREMLLLLDNCEQIVDGVARFIAGLLPNAPRLRVLATSRVPLELRGEQRIDIGPLPVEKNDDAGPAVQLFIERAQQIRPSFEMTGANQESVYEICRRVDGIPLALELAAARVAVLSPEALRTRLSSRLSLLTSTSRDLPERHQTLRAAIEWSYALLRPEEQTAFRALSVFQGGWSLAGAEAVIGLDDVATMEILASLRDKSLVRLSETDDGSPRYSMLETIQEYGFEQLTATDEWDAARHTHSAYFVGLSEHADIAIEGGPNQRFWLATLDREIGNLRAAFETSIEGGDAERAFELAMNLWAYWPLRGLTSEGQRWFERSFALTAEIDPIVRARALRRVGHLCVERGELQVAESLYRAAMDLDQRSCSEVGVASSLSFLGMVAGMQGRSDEEYNLQVASLAIWETLGHLRGRASSLLSLAIWSRNQADALQALTFHRQAIDIQLELDDESGRAFSHVLSARVHEDLGELDVAEALLDQAERVFIDGQIDEGLCLVWLGRASIELKKRNLAVAEILVLDALDGFSARGDKVQMATAFETLAGVCAQLGEAERGAIALGQAGHLRNVTGAPIAPVDVAVLAETQRLLESGLGSRMFAFHLERGRQNQLRSGVRDLSPSGLFPFLAPAFEM